MCRSVPPANHRPPLIVAAYWWAGLNADQLAKGPKEADLTVSAVFERSKYYSNLEIIQTELEAVLIFNIADIHEFFTAFEGDPKF